MLSTFQVSQINTIYQDTYPVEELGINSFKCGDYQSYHANNAWVITSVDGKKSLASVFNKQYAQALMRIANAFYTLSEKDQAGLRPNIAPDLMSYIDETHAKKFIKKHPGGRPKSPIKRRYKQYWISEEEDAAIKKLLAEMRQKDKAAKKH